MRSLEIDQLKDHEILISSDIDNLHHGNLNISSQKWSSRHRHNTKINAINSWIDFSFHQQNNQNHKSTNLQHQLRHIRLHSFGIIYAEHFLWAICLQFFSSFLCVCVCQSLNCSAISWMGGYKFANHIYEWMEPCQYCDFSIINTYRLILIVSIQKQ